MTSPYNARAAYSVSIVAVDRRNLEILMAAAYLFEAMPVSRESLAPQRAGNLHVRFDERDVETEPWLNH